MILTVYWRVKGTWRHQQIENVASAQVLWARQDSARRTEENRSRFTKKHPAKTSSAFDFTPIGEWVYGNASGTCTELSNAGVCVGCLRRDPLCPYCDGKGNAETDTVPEPLDLKTPV